ncbi:MAG: hypothetical protein ABIF71_01395 [Planctomycetota bacterium]
MKDYAILVFGKEGCDKCKMLNKRIDKLLDKPDWNGFEKRYFDVTTVDGLVNFAEAESLHPQRIPSFQVHRAKPDGTTERLRQRFVEGYDADGIYRVPGYVGLETDYAGGGVITPDDIEKVFREAVTAA